MKRGRKKKVTTWTPKKVREVVVETVEQINKIVDKKTKGLHPVQKWLVHSRVINASFAKNYGFVIRRIMEQGAQESKE